MRHQEDVARALGGVGSLVVYTGVAAAQQSEITDSLTQIEEFVATTLGQIGVIVFLLGAAAWFVSRRSADRAQWGWRGMWGGAGMIVLSVSYNVFVGLFENLAPGTIAPILL
ncbi:hypothetical protein BV210_18490 (plasmid) [Halorientalis sp. IM1011]|uniref:hypothetical protein n=1 Tax=Halorientalis sp. IM1011 TaxID=1932360 RepID=UPI00097CD657|nr:hypothetical protein [Halorientalis sp. IM1011]AQL44739.1 hypothetical protein BV210_18490 [Halorientalis sp. IM1011]